MLKDMFLNLQQKDVLVHNITNYVTSNSCANILLASGASPIMADDIGEVEEITSICGGLNINIGTLNERTIKSMITAGIKANELGKPVVLDPVGSGASLLRTKTAHSLIEKVKFSVIKGNISEIRSIALGKGTTKGVDADVSEMVTEDNLETTIEFAKNLSSELDCVIAITGAIDIIANSHKAYVIKNGHDMMGKITGTGCMLSSITCAYIVANPENVIEATAAATCCMGICGEIASRRMLEQCGNMSYSTYLIDAIFNMNAETLEKEANYEIK